MRLVVASRQTLTSMLQGWPMKHSQGKSVGAARPGPSSGGPATHHLRRLTSGSACQHVLAPEDPAWCRCDGPRATTAPSQPFWHCRHRARGGCQAAREREALAGGRRGLARSGSRDAIRASRGPSRRETGGAGARRATELGTVPGSRGHPSMKGARSDGRGGEAGAAERAPRTGCDRGG